MGPRNLAKALFSFLVIVTCAGCKEGLDGPPMRYPTRFGLLTNNTPVTFLNEELRAKALAHPGFSAKEGVLHFKGVNGFRYVCSEPMVSSRFGLHIPLSISNGVCVIQIGNIRYRADSKTVEVFDNQKLLQQWGAAPLEDLSITALPQGSWTTGFGRSYASGLSERVYLGSVDTRVSMPATIRIEFEEDCTGWMADWVWEASYL